MADVCGARTKKDGSPCTRPAGWGTDHVGSGRCKLHGGCSTGPKLKHGRYSLKHRASLAEKMEAFLDDPRPGDLSQELALMRALLADYLERLGSEEIDHADLQRLFDMLSEIAKLVERVSRIINSTALTAAEVRFLQARIADLVGEYIPSDDDRERFMLELSASITDKPAFG